MAGYFFPQVAGYFGGTDQKSILFLNMVLNLISMVAGFFSAAMADKLNRRTLLIGGSLSFAFWFGLMTVACGMFEGTLLPAWGITALIALILFNIFYAMSWTPLNSLYPVECLNYANRATGMAFCQFTINIANVIQTYVLAAGVSKFHWKFFGFYFAFDIFAAYIIWSFFPEVFSLFYLLILNII